jgi:hypothetical protein
MENAMSDLSPEDRSLLELARDAHEPTERDRGRLRGALLLRLGVGTGLAGTAATTSKAATMLALTKVIAAVVIGGAIGGTGVVAYRAAKHGQAQVVTAPSLRSSDLRVAAQSHSPSPTLAPSLAPAFALAPSPTLAPSLALAPEPSSAETTPVPVDRSHARVNRNAPPPSDEAVVARAAPSVVDGTPAAASDSPGPTPMDTAGAPVAPSTLNAPLASPPPTTLEAETRLIRAGVAALHRGDAASALALFDEHARIFPNGALAEERAAERVIALDGLHRCEQARTAAAEFLREHPHSPLAARVREPCAVAPNP